MPPPDAPPLGHPTNRPAPAEPPEGRWLPVPGAGPYIERNTVTGRWRNVRPPPPAGPPVRYPWFGLPTTKTTPQP